MTTQRIVTGHDSAGRSTFISSAPLAGTEEFTHTSGFSAALVWRTEAQPRIADLPVDPTQGADSVTPTAAGGTTALLVTFPPDSVFFADDFDPVAAASEMRARLPGLGERFEAENPGFHRTDTIDYGVVLDGEIVLELDTGRTKPLQAGDIVVQQGTRHAWRNPGNKPARLLFVLIGARVSPRRTEL